MSSQQPSVGAPVAAALEEAPKPSRDELDTSICRKIFWGGCLLLPFLWLLLLIRYRKRWFDRDSPPAMRFCEFAMFAGDENEPAPRLI